MRTKINVISWLVFLVLLNHMAQEKSLVKRDVDSFRIHNVQKVAYRKNFKMKKGLRYQRSSRG